MNFFFEIVRQARSIGGLPARAARGVCRLADDQAGSSELSVSTLLVLGGVACVGVVLPSLLDSARKMGDVFRGQVSVLAGQSGPGGTGASSDQAWSVSVSRNGISASGSQGSFSAGPGGISASNGANSGGAAKPGRSLYSGGPSIIR